MAMLRYSEYAVGNVRAESGKLIVCRHTTGLTIARGSLTIAHISRTLSNALSALHASLACRFCACLSTRNAHFLPHVYTCFLPMSTGDRTRLLKGDVHCLRQEGRDMEVVCFRTAAYQCSLGVS